VEWGDGLRASVRPMITYAFFLVFAAVKGSGLYLLIAVPLNDGQFDALASFTFNFGGGGLQRSTLRRKVNREEHALVPAEFMKWVWAGGRKLKGLVRRGGAICNLTLDSIIRASGIGINEPLDLHDYKCLKPILRAMIRVENPRGSDAGHRGRRQQGETALRLAA
jgi:hypothetical protein